jgi:hypothetical protein
MSSHPSLLGLACRARATHPSRMSTPPEVARRDLLELIEAALGHEDVSAAAVVDLVIRSGWQPRPLPDPNSSYLDGRLRDGTRVAIEIRHARLSMAG